MTVLLDTPNITSVQFKGLDNIVLPFTSHVLEGADDSSFKSQIAENTDTYYIKSVTGLEPPGRTAALSATAGGGKFQGIISEDREIVALIGLNPDYAAGETPKLLRDNLYTMLYTGYDPRVDIQLYDRDTQVCHEYGYVTKFEANIFDLNPVAQITFTMLNPTFRAPKLTQINSGKISENHPDIYNPGTAETGFQFAIKFTDDMHGWRIKQSENRNVGMEFDFDFADGDILAVSTIPGQRYVHWNKHRGKVHNKLSILTADSEWIQLHPGHNHFVVPQKNSKWDWHGKLSFTTHYAGV